jgi:hypothetical protein
VLSDYKNVRAMKKIIKFFALCVIFAQFSGVMAQGPYISVESLPGFPAQANIYQSCTFQIFLSNNDASTYQGTIYILYYTDDSLNTTHDTLAGPFTVNIPSQSFDTIDGVNFTFDSSMFKMGGNVVVVWPVSSGSTAIMFTDTFYTYVEMLGYEGIEDLIPAGYSNIIYPNPADQVIFLPVNRAENSIEYVRIIDVTGRILDTFYTCPSMISTAKFENGIYMIEIKEKNKFPEIMKFIIYR